MQFTVLTDASSCAQRWTGFWTSYCAQRTRPSRLGISTSYILQFLENPETYLLGLLTDQRGSFVRDTTAVNATEPCALPGSLRAAIPANFLPSWPICWLSIAPVSSSTSPLVGHGLGIMQYPFLLSECSLLTVAETSQKRHRQKKARFAQLKWNKWLGCTVRCYKEQVKEVTCDVDVYLLEQLRITSRPMSPP